MNIIGYKQPIEIATSGTSQAGTAVKLNGLLKGVSVTAPDLDNSDTYTVSIADDYSVTIYNDAGLAENSTTTKFVDSNNYPLERPLRGDITVTITASGAQASARSFTVVLYVQS